MGHQVTQETSGYNSLSPSQRVFDAILPTTDQKPIPYNPELRPEIYRIESEEDINIDTIFPQSDPLEKAEAIERALQEIVCRVSDTQYRPTHVCLYAHIQDQMMDISKPILPRFFLTLLSNLPDIDVEQTISYLGSYSTRLIGMRQTNLKGFIGDVHSLVDTP